MRVVELLRIGAFRVAVPAGLLGITWPGGYAALEQETSRLAAELGAMPYEHPANPSNECFLGLARPRFGNGTRTTLSRDVLAEMW